MPAKSRRQRREPGNDDPDSFEPLGNPECISPLQESHGQIQNGFTELEAAD